MRLEYVQCLNCRIGTLQRGKGNYAQWLGDHLVVVSNVSAWHCDVCGDFAYEDETLAHVELLLGSQIEAPRSQRARQGQGGSGGQSSSDDSKQRSAK
jgi:YgiT-type zinc finger domain-containing protein